MFHFKSWLMVTLSNLALVTNIRGLPFRTRGSKSWLLLENPIRSSLHLASFSWNPSRLACRERSSRASWSLLSLPFVTISEQDVSSTYFHMSTGVSKSLIMTRNNQGPSFVPWGTPDGTERHSEWQSWASLTLCFRSIKKYRPWKIVVDLLFTITKTVFDVNFRWSFSENRARKKEKNKMRHHHVSSTIDVYR